MSEDTVAAKPATPVPADDKPATPAPTNDSTETVLLRPQAAYVDPTPQTPLTSEPASRSGSAARHRRSSSAQPLSIGDEDEEEEGGSEEIQSIMLQFNEGGPEEAEVMSPRLEITSPRLTVNMGMGAGPVQHPPRKSSLTPVTPSIAAQLQKLTIEEDVGPPVPPKDPSQQSPTQDGTPTTLHRPPPPAADPEPALPFDFQRFLEQLRHRKADPIARYLKSFLSEFGKRQWMVHEQVKIIGDFLAFISDKMALCDVWRNVSDAEFDNAREGMEKLVMNRLYSQTFSPAIPPSVPLSNSPRNKGPERMGPGRKGQHQEDVERDDVLTQKINIYGWIRESHLDIAPVGDSGLRFLKLAQQELLKLKTYRAPRDKIICVLNCCKVIFGLLKHNKMDSSADSFMPLLIFVVLQANPEHLVSNVQYILRFRNQDKLSGEAGYYLSSLLGAIQFIENMGRTTLTIADDEFERNVEAAVSAIAEKHKLETPVSSTMTSPNPQVEAKPSPQLPQNSQPVSPQIPQVPTPTPVTSEIPLSGLLRSIQNPLTTIGRIFSDEPASPPQPKPQQTQPRRAPPQLAPIIAPSHDAMMRHNLSAEEAAARQASAEAAEAQRILHAEHANVVDTLLAMFPDLDRDVISDVVTQKEGRVGLAVDACLALSS